MSARIWPAWRNRGPAVVRLGGEESGGPPRVRLPERASEVVAALDIGSSRIACALAEMDLGRPRLLAVESAPAYGIRGGEVVDLERASESVRIALKALGAQAGAEIRSVVAGFSGDVKLSVIRGTLPLAGERRVVCEADVQRLRSGLYPDCGPGRRAVQRFDGPYAVGDLRGLERPVGLSGASLAMSSAFLSVPEDRLDTLVRMVHGAEVELEALVAEPLAAALGALSPGERILGAAVLDIGAGGFRGALWEGGRLKQVCARGADRPAPGAPQALPAPGGMEGIVLGLARRFRLAPSVAGVMLQEHGSLDLSLAAGPAQAEVPAVDGLTTVRIPRAALAEALEELLTPPLRALRDGLSEFNTAHAGGVILTGRGARLPGLPGLVSRHFGGACVRHGAPGWNAASGVEIPPELDGPGGCSLAGLLAQGQELRAQSLQRGGPRSWWRSLRESVARAAASL